MQASVSKVNSHVERIRSDIALLARAPGVDARRRNQCRSEALTLLEKRNLIYPPSLLALGLRPDMTLQERKDLFDIPGPDRVLSPEEEKLQEFLAQKGSDVRKAVWVWRMGAENQWRHELGWFPFFVTLTVDPSRVPDPAKMWKDGREWQKYIQRLSDIVTEEMGHRPTRKSGLGNHHYVRYCGVLEHGSSREHHHLHGLIWLRAIPERWKRCPNRGIVNPAMRVNRRCLELEALWPHAQPKRKPAMYFRFEGDVWSKLGFALPIVKGKPMKLDTPLSAGCYVMKYSQKESKEWFHRMKANHGLGLEKLRLFLMNLPSHHLRRLSWRPRTHRLNLFLTTIHSVPNALLRFEAKRLNLWKDWEEPWSDLTTVIDANSSPFQKMCENVRNGHRPWAMSSVVFYDWVSLCLPVPEGYSEDELIKSHLLFYDEFPVLDAKPVSHTGGSIGHPRSI